MRKIYTKPDRNYSTDVFGRPTSIQEATLDFLVLAFVEHVAWTKNSAVTHFAKYLRHAYVKPEETNFPVDDFYSTEVTVGDYPTHPLTKDFKKYIATLTKTQSDC